LPVADLAGVDVDEPVARVEADAAGVLIINPLTIGVWEPDVGVLFGRSDHWAIPPLASALIPPMVGSSGATVSIGLSGSRSSISRSKASMFANFLNRMPIPRKAGLAAISAQAKATPGEYGSERSYRLVNCSIGVK